MASKFERGHDDADGSSNNGQLLRDIKEISKALYLTPTPSKALLPPLDNRSKSTGKIRSSKPEVNSNSKFPKDDVLPKGKKSSSAWNWKKPLKALTHIGYQKFNCCFNLHVHSIDGLPSDFNGISLSVLWKRKNIVLQTRPSRIFQGVAEFDETLMHMCTVYGSQSGSYHPAKYESKLFLIYASLVGAPELDIGKHQIDLTRLLPLSLEDLWGGKSSGKWTTSYRLTGKAKGASLNVSFSFQVIKDDLMQLSGDMNVLNPVNSEQHRLSTTRNLDDSSPGNMDLMLWQSGSVQHECDGLVLPSHLDDGQICHDLLPNQDLGFSKSINFLYQKLDQENFPDSTGEDSEHVELQKSLTHSEFESTEEANGYESDGTDFTIIEQGIETSEEDSLKFDQTTVQTVNMSAVEIIDVDEIIKDDDISLDKNAICNSKNNISVNCMDGVMVDDSKHKHHSSCFNIQSIGELSSVPKTLELLALNPLQPINEFLEQENYMSVKLNYKVRKMAKGSHSLDDITESVASDFLNMLGLESGSFDSSFDGDPQSPREQLLRQFEKEALTSGNFIINFDANVDELEFGHQHGLSSGDYVLDPNLSLIIQDPEEDHARASQSLLNRRRRAKILEDLETEALMQQWGLDERDFQDSPQTLSGGFGSPIELASEELPVLPSVGLGLGAFVQTKDGGFLRSMSPSLFGNAKNGGSLIIQASSPVVLPAKMGNDVMEILLHMASSGVEKLHDHINKLMPLQDITGKSIEHMLWNVTTSMAGPARQQELFFRWDSNCNQMELEEFQNDWRCSNFKSNLTGEAMGLDCMSLEDVAPMTINKIESLLIEGLRMQSGMLNEEAPSYIRPRYTTSTSGGERVNPARFSKLRVAELQIEDSGHIGSDIDGLVALSITLDQWLRLDAGIIEEDQNSEQILNILKVHHPDITYLDSEGFENLTDMAKTRGGKHGFLGNHLTVAFVMQLRDSLRNYEPAGVPMLVLTQVDRVYEEAMQQDPGMAFERKESGTLPIQMENTGDSDKGTFEFRFKITGIHLAGVITKPGKKQLWGTATQQQSGFRWLLANGMGMTAKHASSKSKAIVRSSSLLSKKLQNEDILWSISTNVHAMGTDGKDLTAENAHIRNPDIIFPN